MPYGSTTIHRGDAHVLEKYKLLSLGIVEKGYTSGVWLEIWVHLNWVIEGKWSRHQSLGFF